MGPLQYFRMIQIMRENILTDVCFQRIHGGRTPRELWRVKLSPLLPPSALLSAFPQNNSPVGFGNEPTNAQIYDFQNRGRRHANNQFSSSERILPKPIIFHPKCLALNPPQSRPKPSRVHFHIPSWLTSNKILYLVSNWNENLLFPKYQWEIR